MKNMKLDKLAKEYILNAISTEGRDLKFPVDTQEEALRFLYETFKSEYGWAIKRYSEVSAFREWLQGLPSCFNIDFENYEILQLAVKWGSIPENYTDKQAEKILEMWFNFITIKTFQLFKKYKIV